MDTKPDPLAVKVEALSVRVRKMSAGIRESLEQLKKSQNKNSGGEKSGTICVGTSNGAAS